MIKAAFGSWRRALAALLFVAAFAGAVGLVAWQASPIRDQVFSDE